MTIIKPSPFWVDLDFSKIAKNWRQNRAGTQVATSNSRIPIESLRQSINHLAAYHPATIFTQYAQNDYCYTTAADPLLSWTSYDYHGNNRNVTMSSVYRTGYWQSDDESYFFRQGDIDYRSAALTQTWYGKSFISNVNVERNAPTMDWTDDGFSQYSTSETGVYLNDICVTEDALTQLDTDVHNCVQQSGYKAFSPIRTTEIEYIRCTFHQLRTRNLPMALCWSAATADGCSQAQKSDYTGVAITSTTPINIWDVSYTSRTADSPGSHVYAYRAAVGNETYNVNLKTVCKANARVIDNSGGACGYVRFIGPNHVADNYCDIAVTSGSFGWVGGGVNDYVYLNTAADYNYTGAEKNKIDIHGYVTSSDVLQIIGVSGWKMYQ